MTQPFIRTSRFYLATQAVFLLALLTCCSAPPPPKPIKAAVRPQPPTPVSYKADDYVENLSLASLMLFTGTPDMEAAGSDLDILEAYTATPPKPRKTSKKTPRPAPESVRQEVVILECKAKTDDHMQRLISPLGDNALDREDVQTLAARMNEKACVMYNIQPAFVTVSRGEPLNFDNETLQQVQQQLQQRLSILLRAPEHLPPLDEAKREMQLAQLFIDSRQRDAAYIAVENAKHSLAEAENLPESKAAVPTLLTQLEAIETHLHQVMPFTL